MILKWLFPFFYQQLDDRHLGQCDEVKVHDLAWAFYNYYNANKVDCKIFGIANGPITNFEQVVIAMLLLNW